MFWKLQGNSYPFKTCLHTNLACWKHDPKAWRRGALGKYFTVVDSVHPDQDFDCLVILTTLWLQLKLPPAKCLCPGREQKAAEGPGQVNGAVSQPTSYRHSAEFPGSTRRLGSSPAASWCWTSRRNQRVKNVPSWCLQEFGHRVPMGPDLQIFGLGRRLWHEKVCLFTEHPPEMFIRHEVNGETTSLSRPVHPSPFASAFLVPHHS